MGPAHAVDDAKPVPEGTGYADPQYEGGDGMASSDPTETRPWHLRGNYAPVMDELTETQLEVTGAIPPELSGLYVRNGSNPKSGESAHWFFGIGCATAPNDRGRAPRRSARPPVLKDLSRWRLLSRHG